MRPADFPEVIYNAVDIQEVLAHRYPFLLVDRIVHFEDGQRIVGIKACTINEPFFQGHFPGTPVMPGVLIMEVIAQIGCVLAKKSVEGTPEGKLVYLVGCEEFKWKRPIVPGDVMVVEVDVQRRKRPLWKMAGRVFIDGQQIAGGIVTAADER